MTGISSHRWFYGAPGMTRTCDLLVKLGASEAIRRYRFIDSKWFTFLCLPEVAGDLTHFLTHQRQNQKVPKRDRRTRCVLPCPAHFRISRQCSPTTMAQTRADTKFGQAFSCDGLHLWCTSRYGGKLRPSFGQQVRMAGATRSSA
jgi:hypothetical protein